MFEYVDIINKIKNEKFYIYGAGAHGKKFEKIITKMGVHNNFLGYVVTQKNKDEDEAIREIYDIPRSELIIIAVHGVNVKQIEQLLEQLHFTNYFSIFQYMTELYWGKPYQTNVILKTKQLICDYGNINYRAVVYLAVDSIVNKNEFGKNVYLKMMKISSNENTALLRWNRLVERVENYKEEIIEPYNIKINHDYKLIIDGYHRLILAYYFNVPNIIADLYQININDFEEFYFESIYNDETFYNILDDREIEAIELTKHNFRRG